MADAGPELPIEVRDFLREHIESHVQLALLLLLRGRRGQALTAESVASEQRLPESMADEELRFLCERKLVEARRTADGLFFTYSPASPDLASGVEKLAEVYDEKLLEIMQWMTRNAMERLRTKALRTFADAFVLKRRDDKDG
jgi:hypothetical protein